MTPNATRLKRRWLYLPFAIAAIVMFGYLLLWRTGAAEMKKAIAAWSEDQRAAGLAVSYSDLKEDGFPFFLRIHVENPDITSPGGWAWRTERLTLDALPYDLNRLIFSIRSDQYLSAQHYGDWRIYADDFRASIANDDARDWMFSASINGAQATREDAGSQTQIQSLIFDLSPDPANKTALVLSLASEGVAANAGEKSLAFDKVQTVASVTQTDSLETLDAWRRNGGELVINGFFLQKEEGRLAIAGALSLDEQLQPKGALDTELIAPQPLTQMLAQAGLLTENEAENAAAALTLTAIASGGKIDAPIEFRDGGAHLAGVKVLEF